MLLILVYSKLIMMLIDIQDIKPFRIVGLASNERKLGTSELEMG